MIRLAEEKDLVGINDIYNQAVLAEFETGDVIPVSMQERLYWFAKHSPEKYPVFVFENNHEIYGWLSFSAYRFGRGAFDHTVEISYYIHQKYKRRGVATALIEHAIKETKKLDIKTLVAIILDPNTISIQLMKKFDFTQWGHLPGIAEFNGKECGHWYYGLKV